MVTEDYCSVEIAKLLNEKNFPVWEYHKGAIGIFNGIAVSNITKELIEEKMLSCIPHSVVMKWLRETHNLHITIKPYITTEGIMFVFEIYNLEKDRFRFTLLEKKAGFEKSEEAVNAAIKHCLINLI